MAAAIRSAAATAATLEVIDRLSGSAALKAWFNPDDAWLWLFLDNMLRGEEGRETRDIVGRRSPGTLRLKGVALFINHLPAHSFRAAPSISEGRAAGRAEEATNNTTELALLLVIKYRTGIPRRFSC
jgi:hypothetical protein